MATANTAADTVISGASASSTSSLERGRRSIEFIYGKNANLYTDVLGVSSNATGYQLQDAFMRARRPAQLILQSDKATRTQRNFAEMKIDAATAAFRVLSQPATRALYDQALEAADISSSQTAANVNDGTEHNALRTPSPRKRQWRRLIGKKSQTKSVTPSPPRAQQEQPLPLQEQVNMQIDETYQNHAATTVPEDSFHPVNFGEVNRATTINPSGSDLDFDKVSSIASASLFSGDRYDVDSVGESTAVSSYFPAPLEERKKEINQLNNSRGPDESTGLNNAVIIDEDDDASNHVSFSFSDGREVSPERRNKTSKESTKSPPSALRKSKFDRSPKINGARHRDRTPVTSQRRYMSDRYQSNSDEDDTMEEKQDHPKKKNRNVVESEADDSSYSERDGDESTILSYQSNYTYDNSTVVTARSESVMQNLTFCGHGANDDSSRGVGSSSKSCMSNAVDEIQGSFQDFTTAIDQVWSAFLLQEEEVEEFVKQVDEGKWVLANG